MNKELLQPATSAKPVNEEFDKALKKHETNCCMFERGAQTLNDLLRSREIFIKSVQPATSAKPERELTDEAQKERNHWERDYDNCSCHISPPCGSCTHPGNPMNQEEDETAWMPTAQPAQGDAKDAKTAHEPKCVIYLDEDPIDVAQFYRAKGFQHLPATPTMTGQEIRDCGWKKNYEYQMFIDANPMVPVGTTQAIPLTDGMRFWCIPPATW